MSDERPNNSNTDTRHPVIIQLAPLEWPSQAAQLIHDQVASVLADKAQCSVMLTGGRSAEGVYKVWAKLPAFQKITGVQFYFGDERCVPPEHPESNYGMAMRTLFEQGIPVGCSVFRMEAEDEDREEATKRYADRLPDKIDVLLLGVGEDGHIASIFPGSIALQEKKRKVLAIIGPKPPYHRFTITQTVVTRAEAIFVLAIGEAKARILAKALQGKEDFGRMPACLAISNSTWLLNVQIQR